MKNSRNLYVIVVVLLVLGFISIKTTIKKMQDSGHKVDLIYLKLNSKFEKIESILFKIESLEDGFPSSFDSLQLGTSQELPEVTVNNTVDFDIFNKNILVQVTLLEKVDLALNQFGSQQAENSKEIKDYLETLLDIKTQIEILTKEYNNQARLHNAFIKKFPRNFYSSFFHFQSKPYY